MNNHVTTQASTIQYVLLKLKTATGPIMRVLDRNDHFKVMVLGLNTDVLLADHISKVPAKLTVLKGSVVYRDADENISLFQYDELDISVGVPHSVRGVSQSLCLLTMG